MHRRKQQLAILKTENVLGKVLNVYGTPEKPLFVAKDVAEWIGHTDPSRMVVSLDEDEKGTRIVRTLGGNQRVLVITEDGLYEVLFQSRKPIAKHFKREVKRILRELRTYGFTATNTALEELITDPDLVIKLATQLKESRAAEAKEKLRADLNEQKVCLANNTIRKQAPKVEYHDTVLNSNSDFTATTIAKELGISAIRLNRWMHQKGFQYFVDGHWVLYAKYDGLGYTTTRTYLYGEGQTSISTTFTEKGRKWIHDEWNKK